MARQKLEGIYIPVITPFNKDESINFGAIKEIAKFLGENGVTEAVTPFNFEKLPEFVKNHTLFVIHIQI